MTDDMTCQEVVELVTAYLEGALPPEQAAQFEQHVDSCDGCQRYVDQMRTTIATVGRIEDTDVPPELRDRLLVAFRSRSRT